jgi:hypothetical protein
MPGEVVPDPVFGPVFQLTDRILLDILIETRAIREYVKVFNDRISELLVLIADKNSESPKGAKPESEGKDRLKAIVRK